MFPTNIKRISEIYGWNNEIVGFLKDVLGGMLFFKDSLRNCRRREHPEDAHNFKYNESEMFNQASVKIICLSLKWYHWILING